MILAWACAGHLLEGHGRHWLNTVWLCTWTRHHWCLHTPITAEVHYCWQATISCLCWPREGLRHSQRYNVSHLGKAFTGCWGVWVWRCVLWCIRSVALKTDLLLTRTHLRKPRAIHVSPICSLRMCIRTEVDLVPLACEDDMDYVCPRCCDHTHQTNHKSPASFCGT